ncbi:MAG: hypothetical protein IKX87_11790, partial [Lachnospiraceae bacterium]|nr:hypothetical protein [Lachnospiraceae bacterium]
MNKKSQKDKINNVVVSKSGEKRFSNLSKSQCRIEENMSMKKNIKLAAVVLASMLVLAACGK